MSDDKSTGRCPANMSFPAHFRHLVICCEVSVDMFFQLMTSGYKKCILPLSVGVIAGFKVHLLHKFPFCSFLTHTLFSTADRTQHPPSVPNEGGRFSLHAVIGPVESFNGITQGNGLLNTICWPVLLLFLVLFTLSFLCCLSLFHSWVQGAVAFAGTLHSKALQLFAVMFVSVWRCCK